MRSNSILRTASISNTDLGVRPPIKNNLNEQLKIYYAYRDEAKRECLTKTENRSLSQLIFRHVPSQPPNVRRHTIPSQASVSLKADSAKIIRSNNENKTLRVVSSANTLSSPTSLRRDQSASDQSQLHRSTSLIVDRSSVLTSSTKSDKAAAINSCPLCQKSFDSAGVRRPVNDACGHTTCFQCFTTITIKANGCSLCQKEEELNSQLWNGSSDLNTDEFESHDQSDELNSLEHVLFNEWSLDQPPRQPSSATKPYNGGNLDNAFAPIGSSDDAALLDDDKEVDDKVMWISDDVHDDGPEYRNKEFGHTKEMLERFHSLFGLRKFRLNQQEAINCAMERRYHLFVLMPTGGGKSLCYQLPAALDQGITFVVSPLRSLILDQTQKLQSLGIPCAALTGDRKPTEVSSIYAQCYEPDPKLKLIYITPEKIGQSDQLNKLFSHLYMKNNLARFVIDEAHCISEWGHDFRPDYVKIGILRDRYPRVPFTLLTATATPRVQRDMLHQMKLDRSVSKSFIQSFNRSNLVYKCFPKGKTDGALARTAQLCLSEQFAGLCGIVYCFSRAECERSAAYLTKSGVTAQAYHAGLNDQERVDVQTRWANDEYQVICATIAFGMGIDKPNVRFVIHLSMPKSIEGYYQESGRAGRDGEHAFCYLFYSYQDLIKTKRLIMTEQQTNATNDMKRIRIDNLHRVYEYCLNDVDCRRTLLLQYFGEKFLSSQCKKNLETRCDNCCRVAQKKLVDFTTLSKHIVSLVDQLTKQLKSTTINQVIDILKGSKQKAIKDAGLDKLEQFNMGAELSKTNLERLLSKLILDGYLCQDISINETYGTATAYIRLGKNSVFSTPITLSICEKKESPSISSTVSNNSTRHRLFDACLLKLKEELKLISSQYNIKYSTILSEKALKQMALTMPRTKDEVLKNIVEMTKIKYEMYNLGRLLEITCLFGSKLDDERQEDSTHTGIKRKREAMTTSSYFLDQPGDGVSKKKK